LIWSSDKSSVYAAARPEVSIRLLQAAHVAKKEKEKLAVAGIGAQGMKGWNEKRKVSARVRGNGEITDCSCGTSEQANCLSSLGS